ncbi:hypothetical protein RRG08_002793 [Elysia crispata]|uniref:Uncharacterized protein n=1 Tax=Elysia crispata TaxID=231223 RepID=A0AAE1CMQ2_9GAST|nr:hypothetical protein RRG08_002793 [Elysia crispata]
MLSGLTEAQIVFTVQCERPGAPSRSRNARRRRRRRSGSGSCLSTAGELGEGRDARHRLDEGTQTPLEPLRGLGES